MHKRGFLELDLDKSIVKVNQEDPTQVNAQAFLYHLILPYVESYWITIT